MILNGLLSDWSVGDLLQIIRITGKTAALEVDTDAAHGVFYFDSGRLVDAVCEPGPTSIPSRDRIIDAIYVLSRAESGSFAVGDASPPDPGEPVDVEDATARAEEFAVTEDELRDAGLLDARGLRIGSPDADPAVTSEAWAALAALVGEFTFEGLCERVGRSGAVTTLEEFRSLGLLEAAFDRSGPLDLTHGSETEIELDPEDPVAAASGLSAVVAAAAGTQEASRRPAVGVTAPPETRLVDVSDVGTRFRAGTE